MVVFKSLNGIWRDNRGDAIVEATFFFPLIIIIFFGMVILSVYMPIRASLQRVTQFASTAVATEMSDTWVGFNTSSLQYAMFESRGDLRNHPDSHYEDKARMIARNAVARNIGVQSLMPDDIDVVIVNRGVFKEVIVTASHTIKLVETFDLSFIGFPTEIVITVSSSAIVADGDRYIRNMRLAIDTIESIEGIFSAFTSLQNLFPWD